MVILDGLLHKVPSIESRIASNVDLWINITEGGLDCKSILLGN